MLRFKTLFPDDWKYILDVYRKFLSSTGGKTVKEDLLLMLIETGVRFGERLSRLHFNRFLEICCGLAIPSLTLACLFQKNVKASDIDSRILSLAGSLRDHLGCVLEFQCQDIFNDRPELEKGELLIAEKPASYKKNILEVEYNIRNWCAIEGHNIAFIPSFIEGDTLISYSERCAKYENKFRQVGFKVENKQIYEPLPYRWIIATK